MAATTVDTVTEYEVWYDDHAGDRRHFKAASKDAVKEHISWLRGQDDQKQLLAESVGLAVPAHEYNVEILKVTTTTEPVTL